MKRLLLLPACLFFIAKISFANHITGGEMYYTLTSVSGNDFSYHVVLKLFRDCNSSGAPLDPSASIGIFTKDNNSMVWNQLVPRSQIIVLNLGSPSPCITNPPIVCYEVGYYEFDVTLPGTPNGYTIAYQRCCRIAGINNLSASSNVGATYTADIPGTLLDPSGPSNNSAKFVGQDTVIVCTTNAFSYSFAAVDPDPNDQLSYTFCSAYTGGSTGAPAPDPPAAPPYTPVPYVLPFSGASPMGPGVTINPVTGLVSGIAPAPGIYVITVCVRERRNGVIIATQRKDLQIKVGNCQIAKAELDPRSTTCDGFTVSFQNDAPPSPLIETYFWDFGVASATNDTSNLSNPTFTFPDTGVYIVKLVTNRYGQCSDSATTTVRVYPGFFPGFRITGGCYTNPYLFFDTTSTAYGFVDSWSWNFGDLSTLADTSHLQNPQWLFASPGTKDVKLIVTNSKGCKDSIQTTIEVLDKPALSVAFRDTLICLNDAVQLNASASATSTYSWTPPVNIVGANTATPTVSPTSNQWYYVDISDNGCTNRDSVFVRVVAAVMLQAIKDTTICEGDAIQLNAVSDGLSYTWSPAANLDNPNIINPIAITNSPTTYTVVAMIGGCSASDDVFVDTKPYPGSDAGPDPQICYNTSGQLFGGIVGSSFSWSPTSYLNNPNILNPIASPPRTTQYILTVYDTLGCPKPGRDTVVVIVQPKIRANAGKDTTVVIGQPLLFNGTGGVSYIWSPGTNLSSTTIFNPIGVYGPDIDSVQYKMIAFDEIGCKDSAYVTVYVFKTVPYVFVPTAFTPNNDGLNDVIRPIAVGIRQITNFSIYNRWGERVFYTTTNKVGWNGTYNGRDQASGVYVWMLQAIDYLGKPLFLKGTVTLIR